MKMDENQNVLLTLNGNTLLHVPDHTGFTFHAVAAVGIRISENVSETTARALLLDVITFDKFKKVILTHDSCIFLIFIYFH